MIEIVADVLYGDIQLFCNGHLHDRERARTAEEPGDLIGVPHRCRKPDPLELSRVHVEAFESDRELGPALAAGKLVDLIDDNEPDIGEVLPEPLPHKERLQGLRSGDQEVGR